MDYDLFLASKRAHTPAAGRTITLADIHPRLHPWQADIVVWAVATGRAALWADTGLGKTAMSLEYARLSGDTCLIVAPLAVCTQTVREAALLGIDAHYVRDGGQLGPGVWVTNYEQVAKFDPAALDVVVLDESSCLKQADGKLRTLLIEHFRDVPRKLACSATPAPNDPEELTSQAEFLGVGTRVGMLATYFVHDNDGWRLKGHAREPMFRWMAQWATALRMPSDMGYPDDDYVLPGLELIPELLPVELDADGQLFATELGGVGGRATVRRQTLDARCERAAELVTAEPDEPWLLWTGLNAEADRLAELIPGAVNVHGSMSPEEKADALLGFADGRIHTLITKPSIASLGLNLQRCARMAFVGMNDSAEQHYQAVRRCYRYGQTRVVRAHLVLSELESQIADNVARKHRGWSQITDGLVAAIQRHRTTETAA